MNTGTASVVTANGEASERRRPGLSEYCTRLRLLSGGIGMTISELGTLARASAARPSSLLLSELGID